MHANTQALLSSYPDNDPHWSSVQIYLRGDEVLRSGGVDRYMDRTSKRTWVNAGGITTDTVTTKYNSSSFQFPGNNTSSCLATGDEAGLAFGANDFTMECWFNSMLWPSGTYYPCIMSQRTSSTSNHAFTWYFGVAGTGGLGLRFAYSTTGGAPGNEALKAYSFDLDTWYHVAACKQGSNLYQYVNGAQVGTPMTGLGTMFNSSQVFKIGAFDSTTYDSYSLSYFFGWMSDIRVTNGVARYPAGTSFTPPQRTFPDK
jgi:Concanavalin A-like lectin/glucanases superfamily